MFNNWVLFTEHLNCQVPESIKDQLHRYYVFLLQQNAIHNLTRITEETEVYEKHFLDSLLFTKDFLLTNQKILDIGSGAGFPGIVLKIFFPETEITLVESNLKKATFLRAVIAKLSLKKISVIAERVELYAQSHVEEYDLVVSRAVAKLKILLELGAQLVKINGFFIALKGPLAPQEVVALNHFNRNLNFKLVKTEVWELQNLGTRINLVYQKTNHTPAIYPRKYSAIKKMGK